MKVQELLDGLGELNKKTGKRHYLKAFSLEGFILIDDNGNEIIGMFDSAEDLMSYLKKYTA